MAKTPVAALAALALLLPLAPFAAAQGPSIQLDLQDLPEDVIISPERGTDSSGARASIDVLRYKQSVEGDDAIVELVFAGVPGEPSAIFDAVGQMGERIGQGFMFSVRWDAQGQPAPTTQVSYTIGSVGSAEGTVEAGATSLRVRFPLPAEATCMSMLGSVRVRTDDAEYTDWISPQPSPCDPDALLDGAQGECASVDAPAGADPVVADFADAEGDVRTTTMIEPEGDVVERPQYDITKVTSRRDGDRIVQSVTLAAPRTAEGEILIRVSNRLDADRDGQGAATYAVVPLYWRFYNGSQQDRSHGEFIHDDAKDEFATELDVEGSTYTFMWCASLIPDDARCFGIEVTAERLAYFGEGVRDVARPAIDACAGAGAATPPTTSPADEEPVDEEPTEEDEEPGEGEAESPGLGALALLAALGALALLRRR